MKFILSFCLISVLVSYCAANQLVYGKRVAGDELLYRAHVKRDGVPNASQDAYVSYPKDWKPSKDKEITAVYVQHNTQTTANPQIVIAYDVVKDWSVLKQFGLILRGQLNHGIDTTVQFYGRDLASAA